MDRLKNRPGIFQPMCASEQDMDPVSASVEMEAVAGPIIFQQQGK
jgi:hypothetical protein